MEKDITVGMMIETFSYGTEYVLIGSRTGKKLAYSWGKNKKKIPEYANKPCSGIFPTFRIWDSYITKTTNSVLPAIAIWVAGE